jgi:gamma-glutamylcyclotransferase (GGCT)/AIG2-like uncharacterized protein YtfP
MANVKTFKVFVYGTLLVGESNHSVASPFLDRVKPGKVRGYLYNVGSYPAFVLDSAGPLIKGEWFDVNIEGLKYLDELEDYKEKREVNLYERIWIKDAECEDEGYVYVFTKERAVHLEIIPSGCWRTHLQQAKSDRS